MASDLEQRIIRLEMALDRSMRRLAAAESLAERAWNRPSPPWGGGGGGGGAMIRRARATGLIGRATASGATLGVGTAVFQERSGTSLSDTAEPAFTVYNGTDKQIASNTRMLVASVDGGDTWEVIRVFSCSNLS